MTVKDIDINVSLDNDIVVANKDKYFMGTANYIEVKDIVKDNNKLVILI